MAHVKLSEGFVFFESNLDVEDLIFVKRRSGQMAGSLIPKLLSSFHLGTSS